MKRKTGRPKLADSIDWSSQPLGEVSDTDLARRLGVTPRAVRSARSLRGIPPFTPLGHIPRNDQTPVGTFGGLPVYVVPRIVYRP